MVKLIKILGRWIGAKLELNEGRFDEQKNEGVKYIADTISNKEEL